MHSAARTPVREEQFLRYNIYYQLQIEEELSENAFQFGTTTYQSLGYFHVEISNTNRYFMDLNARLNPINLSFQVRLYVFMKFGLNSDLKLHQLRREMEHSTTIHRLRCTYQPINQENTKHRGALRL